MPTKVRVKLPSCTAMPLHAFARSPGRFSTRPMHPPYTAMTDAVTDLAVAAPWRKFTYLRLHCLPHLRLHIIRHALPLCSAEKRLCVLDGRLARHLPGLHTSCRVNQLEDGSSPSLPHCHPDLTCDKCFGESGSELKVYTGIRLSTCCTPCASSRRCTRLSAVRRPDEDFR